MDSQQNQDIKNNQYPQPKRLGERDVFVGKWLKMKYIDFEIRGKKIENYESIERTTRIKNTPYDGVATFAIIKRDNQPSQLIVIANYRAPVDKFVLEIPAGLMDTPDLIQNAIRELKEETGYTAEEQPLKVSNKESPPTYTDPWRSCSCTKSVFLQVNGNKQENINPKQDLEDAESITVHLIEIDENITDNLTTLAEKHGYIISSTLWCFAQGIQFAKTFQV
ncbi:hypothetical protein ABPG72_013018 [Tetrahymena utriculariae]